MKAQQPLHYIANVLIIPCLHLDLGPTLAMLRLVPGPALRGAPCHARIISQRYRHVTTRITVTGSVSAYIKQLDLCPCQQYLAVSALHFLAVFFNFLCFGVAILSRIHLIYN